MLILPITVSSNQRSFSKLKLIKTYLRSTINNDRLFHLLISSIECDLLDSTDVQQLVSDWTKIKDKDMYSEMKRFLSHTVLFYLFILLLFP